MPTSSPNQSGSITPDLLTPAREAEIGARRAAVTDAPWGSSRDLDGQYTVQAGAKVTLTEGFASSGDVARIIGDDDELRYRRADFIAQAPGDIDALFAEIDRLRRAYIFDTAELKLEIDRLRRDNERVRQSLANGEKVVTARDAELSKLRARVAELEQAAVEGRDALADLMRDHEDPGSHAFGALHLLKQAAPAVEAQHDEAAEVLNRHDAAVLDSAADELAGRQERLASAYADSDITGEGTEAVLNAWQQAEDEVRRLAAKAVSV